MSIISFQDHLNEIFDQPYEFEKTDQFKGSDIHRYKFKSPNDTYTVDIHQPHKETHGRVMFKSTKGNVDISHAEKSSAPRIFSTVKSILGHHMKENPNIEKYSFIGSKNEFGTGIFGGSLNPSRNKLYKHIIKKVAHRHEEHEDDSEIRYVVHRKDIKETINEVIGKAIGNCIEWAGNVVVYDNYDNILFLVPGSLFSFTPMRVSVKLNRNLIVYNNSGQVVSSIPTGQ